MTLPHLALLVATVFFCAWLLTALVLTLALRHRVLDIPSERSSHLQPTPRGGGLGMALAASLGLGWLVVDGAWPLLPVIVAGLALALVGLADDIKPLSARPRLAVQLAAAVAVLASLGAPAIFLWSWQVPGALATGFALLWLLWMTNLYNFMDGIDGLAGLHALAVGVAAAWLLALAGDALWPAPLVVAVAAAGFSAWNFPPARIFMGDTGSGWLGFVLAALALLAGRENPDLLWCWIILLALFASDSTVTLLVRLARGERVYQAHRSHVYQHLTRRWMARLVVRGLEQRRARARVHGWYCLGSVAVVMVWLLPLATAVALGLMDGAVATLLAYGPLLASALWLGGGRDEQSHNDRLG